MTLTFADTHNMIAFLTKLDTSKGFNQIIDFLNTSLIKKKVIITEATIRDALRLDDAEGIECLPNEEIFIELARMWVGKGCSRVETPLFDGMIVAHQVGAGAAEVNVKDVSTAGVAAEGAASAADDEVPATDIKPSIPSPTPPTQLPPPSQDILSTSQVHPTPPQSPQSPQAQPQSPQQQPQPSQDAEISMDLLHNLLDMCTTLTRRVKHLEQDKTAQALEITKLKQRVKKLERRKKLKASKLRRLKKVAHHKRLKHLMILLWTIAARRRKRVVISDRKETATPSTIIHTESKSKHKGKRILVEEPKPLKKQAQIEKDEAYARELEVELTKNIDWDEINEQMEEEDSRALKRISERQEKVAKKQKLDEDVIELKRHLQIVPNDNDDVYTKATPLARKVPVVDYEIYTENKKCYYKIIRADGSP
nr:hypothetical protein [Tanacetum cinerariifolium]